jgi:hypothetical protein
MGGVGRPPEATEAASAATTGAAEAASPTAADDADHDRLTHRQQAGQQERRTSTAMASHLPRLLARLEVLASEPVTSLARSLELVTVDDGTALEISLETASTLAALVEAT